MRIENLAPFSSGRLLPNDQVATAIGAVCPWHMVKAQCPIVGHDRPAVAKPDFIDARHPVMKF
jgi:hypothetical protein